MFAHWNSAIVADFLGSILNLFIFHPIQPSSCTHCRCNYCYWKVSNSFSYFVLKIGWVIFIVLTATHPSVCFFSLWLCEYMSHKVAHWFEYVAKQCRVFCHEHSQYFLHPLHASFCLYLLIYLCVCVCVSVSVSVSACLSLSLCLTPPPPFSLCGNYSMNEKFVYVLLIESCKFYVKIF